LSTPIMVRLIASPTRSYPRLILAASALAFLILLPTAPAMLAKAPPQATTVLPTDVLSAPELGAPALGAVPADTELTLTGAASPGYLEIEYDGGTAWVPAQHLTLGVRPGIDTAVTLTDLPLLTAPMPDAEVVSVVPEGETVILTGASLDGYDAASHDSVGGWLEERGLSRWQTPSS
jgi:hypothetical protein